MKRCISFLFVLFFLAVAIQADWGPWMKSRDFKGIEFRVENRGPTTDKKNTKWGVQFRNLYRDTVIFNYEVKDTGSSPVVTTNRVSLASGQTSSSMRDFYLKSNNQVFVFVDKVRFGKDDLKPYAKPDH